MGTHGFIDVQCTSCHKRYGWYGTILEAPPCPRCKTPIPQAELEHDHKIMEEFRELLDEHVMSTKGRTLRVRMRRAAGLARGQAAGLFGITVQELDAIENEQADPLPALADRMNEAYGCDTI